MSSAAALSVRPCRKEDLGAIVRIYNDAIASGVATWDEAPWTMEQREAWFAAHDERTPVLVAVLGEAVAGFAYLTLMSTKSGWRFTREDTIYVDPAAQGKGVGKALMTALLAEARRIGVRLVVASITSSNTVSLELHRRFGFREVGTLHNAGFKFGEWRDTTYMELDLGAAP
ncbi:MAG: GNAT family N-acetyltransferase [Anaerolinea sp.]|nr:GNAT family N-acetyltransferase [Anaerolinea sp.]